MDDRPIFDGQKFKVTTRAQWQTAAEAWHRWGPFLGQWLGAATSAMFDRNTTDEATSAAAVAVAYST